MPGDKETRPLSEVVEDRARKFFEGAKIGSARLLGLCDTLDFISSRRYLSPLRSRVVEATNKRSVWDRLTGRVTIEMVAAESELHIGEQKVVSIETRMHQREATMVGYLEAHVEASNILDDMTQALDVEFKSVGDQDRKTFRSSEDLSQEMLYEISNEIIRSESKKDND
jgi:hypothetical protein